MGPVVTILHNTSETDALDAHFIAKREAELAMAKGAARGEFVRRVGVAVLLGGAGLGLALFGASFLVAPKVVTVEKEKLVTLPGKETVRETIREVPGPELTKSLARRRKNVSSIHPPSPRRRSKDGSSSRPMESRCRSTAARTFGQTTMGQS